jgi:hypothetical protein
MKQTILPLSLLMLFGAARADAQELAAKNKITKQQDNRITLHKVVIQDNPMLDPMLFGTAISIGAFEIHKTNDPVDPIGEAQIAVMQRALVTPDPLANKAVEVMDWIPCPISHWVESNPQHGTRPAQTSAVRDNAELNSQRTQQPIGAASQQLPLSEQRRLPAPQRSNDKLESKRSLRPQNQEHIWRDL